MVSRSWVSLGVLGLALCAVGSADATAKETCSFEVRSRSKVGYRGTSKYFIKGDWVRQEKRSGGGLELILVSNETGMFIRNKHTNYWFKYPDGTNHRLKDRILGGPIGDVNLFLKKLNAKKTGQEKIKDQMCTIWSYRMPRLKDKFRLWVSAKTGKPVQLERDFLVGNTRKRDIMIVEYRDYQFNAPLADNLFRIPKNEKIHDVSKTLFSSMQGNAKEGAPAAK
jgi:outer membrane lipoprotein-sorting protein